MRKAFVLALMCAGFIAAACGSGNNAPPPVNSDDAAKPVSWDDQSDRDWRHRSQYKTHMRHMWVDCNRIVTAGRGDAVPTWAEIWSSAEDIQRRATLIGGFWRDIAERCEVILECAEDGDRIGASAEYRAMGAACDGCHLATWSPAYLHVTEQVMDGWLKNQTTHGIPEEVDEEPPPQIPNRTVMQKIYFDYQAIELHIESWRVEKMPENLNRMREVAAQRAKWWGAIADNAGTIAELARKKKRDGMREAYTAMTSNCLACHGQNVGVPREVLVPMPWE